VVVAAAQGAAAVAVVVAGIQSFDFSSTFARLQVNAN
jgi:hypothetical protein